MSLCRAGGLCGGDARISATLDRGSHGIDCRSLENDTSRAGMGYRWIGVRLPLLAYDVSDTNESNGFLADS